MTLIPSLAHVLRAPPLAVAGGRQTAVLLREAPSASSFDPFTEWPAGVRRYGARSETDVALIPMFDFANHEAVRAKTVAKPCL